MDPSKILMYFTKVSSRNSSQCRRYSCPFRVRILLKVFQVEKLSNQKTYSIITIFMYLITVFLTFFSLYKSNISSVWKFDPIKEIMQMFKSFHLELIMVNISGCFLLVFFFLGIFSQNYTIHRIFVICFSHLTIL